jgi:hypothetical protein
MPESTERCMAYQPPPFRLNPDPYELAVPEDVYDTPQPMLVPPTLQSLFVAVLKLLPMVSKTEQCRRLRTGLPCHLAIDVHLAGGRGVKRGQIVGIRVCPFDDVDLSSIGPVIADSPEGGPRTATFRHMSEVQDDDALWVC